MSEFIPDSYELLFAIRRAIRYHTKRREFFELVDRGLSFLLILLGSGVMAQFYSSYLGLAIAAFASLKLVFGPGLRAGNHARLAGDFIKLEQELVRDDSNESVEKVMLQRLDLEATEPPVLRVLDAMCHNEICRAMDLAASEYVPITPIQRLTAQLFSWDASALNKKGASVS